MANVPPPSALPAFLDATLGSGASSDPLHQGHHAIQLSASADASSVPVSLPSNPILPGISSNASQQVPILLNVTSSTMSSSVSTSTPSVDAPAFAPNNSSSSIIKNYSTLPVTSQPKPPLSGDGPQDHSAGEREAAAGSGWVGWLKGTVSNVSHKVAQRAKTSMDSMITTLDPQMKEFLNSGGDLDLVVASDKEIKVGPVREAFQQVFGMATVSGIAVENSSEVAAQPVGVTECIAAAEHRINAIRGSGALAHPSLPVLAIESCIVELSDGCWYDIAVLLLDDPYHDVILQTFTQSTSIPSGWAEECQAGTDDQARQSGLQITIGSVAAHRLQVDRSSWHESWCGVSRREMLYLAARSLAHLYSKRLPQ